MMASLLQRGRRRPPAADHGGSSLPLRSGAKGGLSPYVYRLGFGCRSRSRSRSRSRRCRRRRLLLLLLHRLELAEKCEVDHALGLVPLAEHPKSAGETEAPGREARGREALRPARLDRSAAFTTERRRAFSALGPPLGLACS
ncbi:unnamed protein product [Ectocarpus sp. 12 AP-2014]